MDAIGADQWEAPTPCSEWNVRQLANHVVGEELWTVPLMRGATIEEVGDKFDGDVLGDDPQAVARSAAEEAATVVSETLPSVGKVHLSYGQEDASEYVYQLAADHLIHGWDLAAATGGNTTLDPELVEAVASWFASREEGYRSAGAIGPRVAPQSGDPQTDLLAGFGRTVDWTAR
jgi:uncharacterized protein (TIGR03086 family)